MRPSNTNKLKTCHLHSSPVNSQHEKTRHEAPTKGPFMNFATVYCRATSGMQAPLIKITPLIREVYGAVTATLFSGEQHKNLNQKQA